MFDESSAREQDLGTRSYSRAPRRGEQEVTGYTLRQLSLVWMTAVVPTVGCAAPGSTKHGAA